MVKIVVTGANGFVGKHLIFALQQQKGIEIFPISRDTPSEEIRSVLKAADLIYHLAGVNRPVYESEFQKGNVEFTKTLTDCLKEIKKPTPIVYSSSLQATVDNAYGKSKLAAEQILEDYSLITGAKIFIYRLKNIFGSRCRPNYNSVVATFCHNITRDLPISINNSHSFVDLVWVGDVVNGFLSHLPSNNSSESESISEIPSYSISLQDLSEKLYEFAKIRKNGFIPNMSDRFLKLLHSTFISYYPIDKLAASVDLKSDPRGSLFELIRSREAGQIFVSTTKPGATRGNHHHISKIEKFCVIHGEAEISFRDKDNSEIYRYLVSSVDIQIIDIPPGYTHKIVNVGQADLTTIFWANEPFDPQNPDTYFEAVER